MSKHRVLNLGAGTQSSVLYLMMCRGDIPPAEVAVFSDTRWEPKEVYDHLAWLEQEGGHRIPIAKVSQGNLRKDIEESVHGGKASGGKRFANIPLFVLNPDGGKSIKRRQCTYEYKIRPITLYTRRKILGLKHGQRVPKGTRVERVFGISFDEMERMKHPEEKWIDNVYPLVDMRMRRQQVIDWAARHYPGRTFPRSACIGCPFKTNEEWRKVRDTYPDEWRDTVELDKRLRVQSGLKGKAYFHRSCVPLGEVDLREDDERSGQMSMFGMLNECEGMCGV